MSSIAAAAAYANVARLGDPSASGLGSAAGLGGAKPGGEDFGAMLRGALDSIQSSAKAADGQAVAMAKGNANVVDVVTAVAETEVAIDALVAVRDRVIQSYEEIMRMPI